MGQLVETKVTASAIGAGLAGAVVWALQTWAFKGSAVPPGVVTLVDLAVPAAAAWAAGYLAPHTPRAIAPLPVQAPPQPATPPPPP